MSLCGKGLKNRGKKRSKKRGRVAPRKRGITVRKASMVGIEVWKEEGHFRGMERQEGKRGWTGKRIEDEGEQEEKQTERNKTGTAPMGWPYSREVSSRPGYRFSDQSSNFLSRKPPNTFSTLVASLLRSARIVGSRPTWDKTATSLFCD